MHSILMAATISVNWIIKIRVIGYIDMRFTLRQLQVFVAVAQQESVSRAAGLLALSQSAASTSITELERQSSCQLFDRAGKRLSLNALGRQLLPQAVALLDQAKEIEDLLNGKSGFGSLAVGATLTIGNYLATLLIGSFMQQHPESQVKLHVQNTAHIVHQVAHYEIDLGLIEGDCSHPDIEVQTWVEDELVVFCAPQHHLAKRGVATMEELTHEAWILREQGSGTRLTFDQAMRHHRSALNIRLELEHTEAIKRAVESGLGIGCISRLALRDAFRRGSLVPVETPDLDLARQFYFIWHKQKYQTSAMREFLELCRAFTAGVQRSDEIVLPSIA
ncbi:HTH-type transcriptional activator CmpR [Pseudomonas extremaustralis]|nr:HTH-type transcriptional activator CmpR [Pseudomonas extremaustralis]